MVWMEFDYGLFEAYIQSGDLWSGRVNYTGLDLGFIHCLLSANMALLAYQAPVHLNDSFRIPKIY